MEIVSIRSMIVILLSLGLSACGGGGGGGGSNSGGGNANVTPVASSGFATSSSTFDSNATFTPTNASYTTRTVGGTTVAVNPATLELVFSQNGDRLSIRVGRFNYEMEENGGLAYIETSSGPTLEQLFIRSVSGNGDAKLAQATSDGDVFGKDVYFVYGFDTNPTALSGDVTYSGDVFAVANQVDNTAFAGGSNTLPGGSITLTADFNDNKVSGRLNLDSFSGLTGASSYDLSEADINGNNFSGTFVATSLDTGQSATDTVYDGRFFGTDGDAAGGGIGLTITESGQQPIYVQGAFLAEE